MRRPVRRSIHVAPAIVACLLLTSCAYITRVSGEFGPTTPAVSTLEGDVSDDGSMVVFLSDRAFDTADANGVYDVIISDRNQDLISRVSMTPSGVAPNSQAAAPRISGNGQYVVWSSTATDILPGNPTGISHVYRANLATGAIERISVSSAGAVGNAFSANPSISDDGRYVAFSSNASNLVAGDTNGQSDIFVRNTITQKTSRRSTTAGGAQVTGLSTRPDISGDGSAVAFASDGVLVASDTNLRRDIYLKRADGSIDRVSIGVGGIQGDQNSDHPRVNRDGTVVAFESDARNLDPRDTNIYPDVFVWSGTTAELVSLGPGGTGGTGGSSGPRLDGSGQHVGFMTTAGDISGTTTAQAVIRDLVDGHTDVVSSDLSGAPGDGTSTLMGLSGHGRFALIRSTSTNLVSNDTNGVADMFVKSYPQPEITSVSPSALGAGTTTVTIKGRGFAAPMAVMLQDNPGVNPVVGPVTVIDSKTLTVDITVTRDAATHQPVVVVTNSGAFVGDLGASGVCGGCLTIHS